MMNNNNAVSGIRHCVVLWVVFYVEAHTASDHTNSL